MSRLLRRAIQQSGSSSNFVTSLWSGTGAARSIVTDLDNAAGSLVWIKRRDAVSDHILVDTARGSTKVLSSNLVTPAETTVAQSLTNFNTNGFSLGTSTDVNGAGGTYVGWSFLDAVGFKTTVLYTGDGVAGRVISHSLGADFGMAIVRDRTAVNNWYIQHRSRGGTKRLFFDNTAEGVVSNIWNDTDATSNTLILGAGGGVNTNTDLHVAHIFAHNPSKGIFCGQYTGNGLVAGPIVDLGFVPRFILVKCATGVGGWLVFDTARGIVVGNDPYLTLHQSSAEVFSADFLELTATGFQIKNDGSSVNTNGASYIYMAIR